MKDLFEYLIETIICSGVFMLLYRLLLSGKVSFGWQRSYLLLSVAASALIPLLNIPVYPAQTVVLETQPALSVDYSVVATDVAVHKAVNWQMLFWIAYALCFATLTIVSIVDMVRIARLRRSAHHTIERGTDIYESQSINAPFSFLRSVYLCCGLCPDEREQVVRHEQSHIAHHHSEERLAMSLLRGVEWFNPFAWIAHRSLNEIHEYQADADLLVAGYDIGEYRILILKQLLGYNPDIGCGLNNSLTKKRFIMMTKKIRGRHTLLRTAAVVPAFAAMLMIFGFTAKPTVYLTEPTRIPTSTTVAEPTDGNAPTDVLPAVADDKRQKSITVSGTVTGDEGPIAGAMVVDEQTKGGVVTDKQGRFSLKVANGTTLKTSFVGYRTHTNTIDCQSRKLTLDIRLNSSPIDYQGVVLYGTQPQQQELSQIVIVGYGEQPVDKPATSGRIEAVHNDTGEGVTIESNGDKAADQSDRPNLRFGHRNPDAKPLFIVDGVEVENIESLNPDQIEKITVLKDEKATAPYGAKGVNGIVVVTTKVAAESRSEAVATEPADEEQAFLFVDQMPKFNGGSLDDFRLWALQHFRYPTEAQKKNIEGRVVVQFVIDTEGNLGRIRIVESPDKLLSDEVTRVLQSSPAWSAGSQRGQKVNVKFSLPLQFRLSAPAAPKGEADQKTVGESADNSDSAKVLCIIDGKQAPVESIDADRIDSVIKLNSEQATKLYGSSGRNGAVIIVSKSASKSIDKVLSVDN